MFLYYEEHVAYCKIDVHFNLESKSDLKLIMTAKMKLLNLYIIVLHRNILNSILDKGPFSCMCMFVCMGLFGFKGASTSQVIGARNEMMIIMAKLYSGTLWA